VATIIHFKNACFNTRLCRYQWYNICIFWIHTSWKSYAIEYSK